MVGLNRGRRPPPIQIPKHERRQDGEIDSRETPTRKTSPFPTATSSILTSRVVLRPSIVSQPNEATTPALSPQRTSTRFSTRLTPKPERGTSLELSIPTQPPTTTSNPTPSQSPTKTTFVTVTQSVGSPKEKQETPGATKTVFVSGIPEVVTVTAPAQATDPSSLNSGTSKTQEQSALPLGAVKPLIALGVIGQWESAF